MHMLAGQKVPDFVAADLYGNRIALEDYRGVFLLLSFYRFASCPICNLRMWQLAQHAADYQRQSLHFMACIESSPKTIHHYRDRIHYPFPLIPDLGGNLYRMYGIETSLPKVMKGLFTRPGTLLQAYRRHLGSWAILPSDGPFARLPADFLIDPGGRILLAYYGQYLGDFLPIDGLDLFLRSRSPLYTPPAPFLVERSPLGL